MSRIARVALLAAILLLSALAKAEISAWTPLGDTTLVGIVSGGTDGSVLLARRQNQDPVRSVDGGVTWSAFSVLGVRPDRFVAAPTDSRVFYAISGGVAIDFFGTGPSRLYRTRDSGATWELVAAALVSSAGAPLGDLVVGANPDLVFASGMGASFCMVGCAYEGKEAFISTDGALTWRSIDAGLEASGGRLLYPSLSDPRVVYATTSRGIYRSDNQGVTWRFLLANPSDPYFYTPIYQSQVLVDRGNPLLVYMRPKPTEVWVSEDGGENWRISDPGPVPGPTRGLLVDPVVSGRSFLLGDEGEIFQSDDRARTWKRVAPASGVSNLGGASGSPRDTYPVVAASGARRVFLAARLGTSRRLDLGANALALGSDLWWNPAENGMGYSITQHASGQIFAAWYAYDAQGRSTWRFVSGGTWLDDRTFTGGLNETSGPAFFQGTFDPARVNARTIGTVTLHFDDSNNATFSYRLSSGEAGEKRLTRYLFGPRSNAQHENYSDTWWNPTESGWGMSISTQYGTLVAIWFVYDEAGRPTWISLSTMDVRLSAEGSFLRPQYHGDIYAASGPAAGAPFDPARVVLTKVGTASVTFPTRTTARVEWSAFGQVGSRPLVRLPF